MVHAQYSMEYFIEPGNRQIEIEIDAVNKNLDFVSISIISKSNLSNMLELLTEKGLDRKIEKYDHSTNSKLWISEQVFLDEDVTRVLVKCKSAVEHPIKIRVYEVIKQKNKIEAAGILNKQSCPCPQPAYFDRDIWCLGNNCPESDNPTITAVTHQIIHHSAGTNVSDNWPAIITSIWDFHVNSNGWNDIGYNWLIDPDGIIYEGRGDNIRGAHFCGMNTSTSGICLIGDFTNIEPTQQCIASLREILAWKSCDINIDPLESSLHEPSAAVLPNISGHRDGCATQCPGNTFYPTIQTLREEVKDQITFACESLSKPTDLTANTLSSNFIQLNWNDNSLDETHFIVEKSAWTNQSFQIDTFLQENTTNYIDEKVTPNTVYFYRISATNQIDTSDYSNEFGISTILQNVVEQEQKEIEIFPNPASNYVSIRNKNQGEKINLQIYNYEGVLIKTVNNPYNVSIESWTPGWYLFSFHKNGLRENHSVLVQNK